MTLRLFKDVGFTFVGRNTLRTCYFPNFGYDYETPMHGTAYTKILKNWIYQIFAYTKLVSYLLNKVEIQNTRVISDI